MGSTSENRAIRPYLDGGALPSRRYGENAAGRKVSKFIFSEFLRVVADGRGSDADGWMLGMAALAGA
jgi:hypothetical protein